MAGRGPFIGGSGAGQRARGPGSGACGTGSRGALETVRSRREARGSGRAPPVGYSVLLLELLFLFSNYSKFFIAT